MNEQIQEQVVLTLAQQVTRLFTDQVWIVLMLVLAGIAVGMAFMQFAKPVFRLMFRPRTEEEIDRLHLLYKVSAHVAGFVWTLALEMLFVSGGMLAKLIVGSAAAMVAGGATPSAYDLWRGLVLPWLKGRLFGHAPPQPGTEPASGSENTFLEWFKRRK